MPPTLSDMFAATTTTAIKSPRVSTIPKVLRPLIFFPASNPLVFLLTVAAARTERASTMPADGAPSRPSFVRTAAARRSAMRSQVPSLDHSSGSDARCSSSGSYSEVLATDNPSPSRRRWRRPHGGDRP
jgi:hypothetical protein